MAYSIDEIDRRILRALQLDSSQSQRVLAEKVGLSQNACWRRIRLMEEAGLIRGRSVKLDANALGFGMVVFMMVRTRSHSADWLRRFRAHVSSIREVVDFYRIGGDYDYLLKIVTHDMKGFDRVYQRLIEKLDLETVTSYFVMETIEEHRGVPV
ncbi:MAG: Lrp/AsnC family transcriptional regulator [Paracoccus sp. (in: a-proteobacteria)]|nr:Lrp/AsnC family transcriptional regulator [Paracoccus sp. (in: a-proteobacteria)]